MTKGLCLLQFSLGAPITLHMRTGPIGRPCIVIPLPARLCVILDTRLFSEGKAEAPLHQERRVSSGPKPR